VSIIEWSNQIHLNFDKDQMLAFQIIIAAFVLTYYYDDASYLPDEHVEHATQSDFNNEKKQLQQLARLTKAKPHLRMFLDGAAGSGKSHVVKAGLHYAKGYTTHLSVPFDMRTIVVTALSGIAATAIGGETTHSELAWNRAIDPDKDSSWLNARLVTINECSFMNVSQVELLDEKLRFSLFHMLIRNGFTPLLATLSSKVFIDLKMIHSGVKH
jgi:hypothetical protein